MNSAPRPAEPDPTGGIADLADVLDRAKDAANETESRLRTHYPLPGRTDITIPYTTKVASRAAVSLNQVHDDAPFIELDKALSTEADTELRRTLLKPDEEGKIRGVQAEARVEALALDIPLEASSEGLVRAIMRIPSVRPVGAAGLAEGGGVAAGEPGRLVLVRGGSPQAEGSEAG